MTKLTLNESLQVQKCEVHDLGNKPVDQDLCSSLVHSMDKTEDQNGNPEIHATTQIVPEFWEFSYLIHPNLDGLEYPTTVEVIIFKNGSLYCNEWFENSTTKKITNIGLAAITKCCSDKITDFREQDIVNFYLSRSTLTSLSKTRIKSKTAKSFIDIIVYLASVTHKKCNLMCSKNFELLSHGQPPIVKKKLTVYPTQEEIKNTISDHTFKQWVKKFNSVNRYHQTVLPVYDRCTIFLVV